MALHDQDQDELAATIEQLAAVQAEQQRILTELVTVVARLVAQLEATGGEGELEAARDGRLREPRQARRHPRAAREAMRNTRLPPAEADGPAARSAPGDP